MTSSESHTTTQQVRLVFCALLRAVWAWIGPVVIIATAVLIGLLLQRVVQR